MSHLTEAIQRITRQRVEDVIHIARNVCQALGIAQPRIAVADFNPHANEDGLFGDQGVQKSFRRSRLRVPTDSMSVIHSHLIQYSSVQPKVNGDIVVAMYHDQGHNPMKLFAFDTGVNVSVGPPILRTSVDHGTAFDITGTGRACEQSMLAAIDVAIQLGKSRPVGHRAG